MSNQSENNNNSNIIYVTGFGPFVGHEKTNASWEAVRRLPDSLKFNDKMYILKKLEIPVVYEEIDKILPTLWECNPKLVIHCGVHGRTNKLHLEKYAYNDDYCKPDWNGKCLPSKSIPLMNSDRQCLVLRTNINVDKIIDDLQLDVGNMIGTGDQCNEEKMDMYKCSEDVGNYICGYTYLKSLDINPDRTLFIHVPCENKPFTAEQTKSGIFAVLQKCMEQLDENQKL